MASVAFDKLKELVFNGDFASLDLKAILVEEINPTMETSAGNPLLSAAVYPDVVRLHNAPDAGQPLTEISGTGYTTGGKFLENVGVSVDGGVVSVSASNLTWEGATTTFDAGGVLLINFQGLLFPPIAYLDFGVTRSNVNGPFTLQWLSDGIFKVE